ncbi:MAG: IS607 family element RNA-guided endonuclease TnpB, partial [Acidimicrobiales bacterium]
MLVHQAYRFELDPNNVARSALASHAGAARFAYNWGRARVIADIEALRVLTILAVRQGATGNEAKAWATEALDPMRWNLPALRREWNAAKAEVAPWWATNSKEAYNSGLDGLARGLDAWSRSRHGQRKGRPVGFPRPHRRHARRSFRVTTGAFGVIDHRHVRLPRIGVIRTKEPTTRLGAGSARILSVTVSESAGRWYASFGCEVERPEAVLAQPDAVVGVDVGVGSLAVVSTGEVIANPKHGSRYARRMARFQRQCSRRQGPAKGQAPSKRWGRSKTALGRAHARLTAARSDGLHKLTTALASTYGRLVIEDLNVAGMTASAKGSWHWRGKAGLNRAVLDVAPATLARQLAYKCAWYGSTLVVADRWYPSSKTCSTCKTVKTKLSLAERSYRCEHCGLVIDRDFNAALNLASLVEAIEPNGTASGAGTSTLLRRGSCANGRGEERSMGSPRCSSTNRQDGT